MSFVPTFSLYDSANTSLVYTFDNVVRIDGWPTDNPSSIEYTNLRSSGSIIIPEGNKSYAITINGILIDDNYTDLTTKIFAIRDTIVANTKYTLRLDKTVSTYDTIKVMRLVPIVFEDSKRIRIQRYSVALQALSWS